MSFEEELSKVLFSSLLAAQSGGVLALLGATVLTFRYLSMDGAKKFWKQPIRLPNVRIPVWVPMVPISFIGNIMFATIIIALVKSERFLCGYRINPEIPPTYRFLDPNVWSWILLNRTGNSNLDSSILLFGKICIIAILINWVFFCVGGIAVLNTEDKD